MAHDDRNNSVTLNDVQRAALALFAAREAGHAASLDQMKAIAYCVRNRVKAGWHDGQWLTVIEHSEESAGNLFVTRVMLDPNNRILQRIIADIDDIYYGLANFAGQNAMVPTAQRFAPDAGDIETAIGKSCYWCWLNRPFTTWFEKNILRFPESHPMRAQLGLMGFFE
jgi:hypothetical protein